MRFNELGDTKYIALETFKKNGQGVVTPVWVIGKEGKLYAWTDGNSWKVKRIRNKSHVRVCQCDRVGKLESDWIEAQADILVRAEDHQEMAQDLAAKYGLLFKIMHFWGKLTRRTSNPVVIEISPKM
ncbi:MAG: PPOX class F420-dependent oxidoreductase [Ardenticatenaceae bacterium]